MEVFAVRTDKINPPKDDLLERIKQSDFAPQNGDVVAVTSKVVSIDEGRCVHQNDVSDKDELIKAESEKYLERSEVPGEFVIHTYKQGHIIPSSGIDKSNSGEYFVLWPEDPMKSARELLAWMKKQYGLSELYLVLTDSHSTPLRRGVTGFALAWAGFDPLYDYRERKDIFGEEMNYSMINLPDSLAGAATFVMGEGEEQTPLAILRNAPFVREKQEHARKEWLEYQVPPEEDLYAPFFKNANWKKGGEKRKDPTE